jgi:DNA-binding CsgD family transcriptional regulator
MALVYPRGGGRKRPLRALEQLDGMALTSFRAGPRYSEAAQLPPMSADRQLLPTVGQVVCPVVVGRDAEIARLEEALAEAREGRGGLLLLVGEPGIGKSRLSRETEARAGEAGMRVLRGRAAPSASPIPFRPIAEALQASFRHEGMPGAPELELYLPALRGLVPEWGAAAAAAEISPLFLLEAVVRILGSLAGTSGLLLILEDLHWADADTLAVVDYLADNLERESVLCVATMRDEPGAATDLAEALAARRASLALRLARLSTAETAEMARRCLDGAELPRELLDPLAERAEGVPFVIEEMLTAYVASGSEESIPATLPHTFRALVRARLDAVDERTRRILFAAAVVGRRFEPSLLSALTSSRRDEVLESVRVAVEAKLVTTDVESGFELPFGFRHALVREALLAELLPPELAELSARAARAIEERFPGLPGEWCERAADLREAAGDGAAAARHLQEAAQRALARGALASAEAMLEHARTLVAGDRWHVLGIDRQLAEVLSQAGKVERLREIAAAALAFVQEKRDAMGFITLGLGDLHLRLARGMAAAGDASASAEHLANARDFALQVGEKHLLARIRVFESQRALEVGELTNARTDSAEAREQAEQLGLPDVLSEALSVEGQAAFLAGEVEHALATLARARYEAGHSPLARIRALLDLGAIESAVTGDLESLTAARESAVEAGAVSSEARADMLIGSALVSGFELDRAGEHLARCIRTCRRYRLALLSEALAVEAQRLALANSEREAAAAIDEAGTAFLAGAVLSFLREDRAGAKRELREASDPTAAALGSLLTALDGETGEAAAGGAALSGGLLAFADAALSTKQEAPLRFAAADAQLAPFPWWRHLARRLVAESALERGWGDPAGWIREDLLFFEAAGHERIASACKALLRRAGAPVPRKGRGDSSVPPELRARGVTSREMDVLRLVAERLSNREIAARLFLSPRTIETHVASLTRKLDVGSRAGLGAIAADFAQEAEVEDG